MNNPSSEHDENRVVPLRPHATRPPPGPPVADLTKFESEPEAETPEAYRHRMVVNLAALAFLVVLVGSAIWLADVMASMRKNQDCVLSGRRGCASVEYTPQARD